MSRNRRSRNRPVIHTVIIGIHAGSNRYEITAAPRRNRRVGARITVGRCHEGRIGTAVQRQCPGAADKFIVKSCGIRLIAVCIAILQDTEYPEFVTRIVQCQDVLFKRIIAGGRGPVACGKRCIAESIQCNGNRSGNAALIERAVAEFIAADTEHGHTVCRAEQERELGPVRKLRHIITVFTDDVCSVHRRTFRSVGKLIELPERDGNGIAHRAVRIQTIISRAARIVENERVAVLIHHRIQHILFTRIGVGHAIEAITIISVPIIAGNINASARENGSIPFIVIEKQQIRTIEQIRIRSVPDNIKNGTARNRIVVGHTVLRLRAGEFCPAEIPIVCVDLRHFSLVQIDRFPIYIGSVFRFRRAVRKIGVEKDRIRAAVKMQYKDILIRIFTDHKR